LQGKGAVSNPHRPPLARSGEKAAEMRLRARRTRSVLRCSALHKTEFQFSTERGRGLAKNSVTTHNKEHATTTRNNKRNNTQQRAAWRSATRRRQRRDSKARQQQGCGEALARARA